MAAQSVTPWKDAPAEPASGTPVVGGSAVNCFSSCVVWSSVLVLKDRVEVCPLARGGLLHPLSTPLQRGFRFFHLPLPALPSAYLTVAYRTRRTTGLPCSASVTKWVRFALFAGDAW